MEHLAQAVERSLQTGNSYAALVLAMTLPDVCGWVEGSEQWSKNRYVAFFEKYMAHLYVHPVGQEGTLTTFLTGEDFYALRCALVHEGRDDISLQKARQVLESFQFVSPPPTWTIHRNLFGSNQLQLQVDVFCREILSGVYAFLVEIQPETEAAQRIAMLARVHDIHGSPI